VSPKGSCKSKSGHVLDVWLQDFPILTWLVYLCNSVCCSTEDALWICVDTFYLTDCGFVYSADADAADGIRRTLCSHVTIGTQIGHFCRFTVFWLFLTIGTLLAHSWYSLGRHVTIGIPMVIFCCFDCLLTVLTVFDCFLRLVHCWYSFGRPVTIGTPMVKTVPTVYQQRTNRQKQSKDSQNSKNDTNSASAEYIKSKIF